MRLALVIGALHMGGAQRVLTTLANAWVEKGHTVTIITFATPDEDFFPLHHSIKRIPIGGLRASANPVAAVLNNLDRQLRLRQAIQSSRPDVIISFIDTMNVLTILARIGTRIPLIISERVDPRQHRIGRAWSGLRRVLYPLADALIVQTKGVQEWATEIMPERKVYCIPNPVSFTDLPHPLPLSEFGEGRVGRMDSPSLLAERGMGGEANPLLKKLTLITAGRLIHTKGFDLLIRAFAMCAEVHPQWCLRIVGGDGDQKDALESLANTLGIADRVAFGGKSTNIVEEFVKADLFVLPSRYEGFPNTLLEAMACGLPVIAADCPSGPRDMVQHGVNGLLVPPENVDALAAALDELMSDAGKRVSLGNHALDVRERFSLEKIMEEWNAIIEKVRDH